jgi:hypothetical protein
MGLTVGIIIKYLFRSKTRHSKSQHKVWTHTRLQGIFRENIHAERCWETGWKTQLCRKTNQNPPQVMNPPAHIPTPPPWQTPIRTTAIDRTSSGHQQHNTTNHNTTQRNTTQHNATQRNTPHHTTPHHTTRHDTTPHDTTPQHTTPHHTTAQRHNDTPLNPLRQPPGPDHSKSGPPSPLPAVIRSTLATAGLDLKTPRYTCCTPAGARPAPCQPG